MCSWNQSDQLPARGIAGKFVVGRSKILPPAGMIGAARDYYATKSGDDQPNDPISPSKLVKASV